MLFRALRHRDFRIYVAGQVISVTGTWVQSLALSWLVYRLTHSTLLMGTVGFAGQIPVLLLGPLGGLVADRFPRRRIVILMQCLMMAQASALAILTFTGTIQVWMIVALGLVLGRLNAFVFPARHFASSDTDPALPRMGERLRLKAGVDISGLPRQARVVARAFKEYGLIVADNGSDWYV